VEAIVLGARLTRDHGDPGLARAADDVLAKVAAVLPSQLAQALDRPTLLVPARSSEEVDFGPHLPELRRAVCEHVKVRIHYADGAGRATDRVVWPLTLLFYSHVALLGAWCKLREDYCFFRTGRIGRLDAMGERFSP
jgi:predicted DNA-binding transcriptional regulator YafY